LQRHDVIDEVVLLHAADHGVALLLDVAVCVAVHPQYLGRLLVLLSDVVPDVDRTRGALDRVQGVIVVGAVSQDLAVEIETRNSNNMTSCTKRAFHTLKPTN